MKDYLILLLFIAVPVKYILLNETYVKILGMPHGVLFVMYIVLAFIIKKEMKWNTYKFFIVLLASLIPFGTFYIEKKFFRRNSLFIFAIF